MTLKELQNSLAEIGEPVLDLNNIISFSQIWPECESGKKEATYVKGHEFLEKDFVI